MDNSLRTLLYILSPTYCVITFLKKSKRGLERTKILKRWSSGAIILTVVAVFGILIAEYAGPLNRWVLIVLGALALSRVNELVFAFFHDASSRLAGEAQTTTFTAPERLRFVAVSYLEVIVCFGFIYLRLQPLLVVIFGPTVEVYKTAIPSLADSIYLSSNIITTIGYGENEPKAWLAKVLSTWEVFSGFILFAVALAVYLGSEKVVPSSNFVAPVSTSPHDGDELLQRGSRS
jgi:hypothetical protein